MELDLKEIWWDSLSLILIVRKESEYEVKHEIQNLKLLIQTKDLLLPSVRNWCSEQTFGSDPIRSDSMVAQRGSSWATQIPLQTDDILKGGFPYKTLIRLIRYRDIAVSNVCSEHQFRTLGNSKSLFFVKNFQFWISCLTSDSDSLRKISIRDGGLIKFPWNLAAFLSILCF